MSVRADLAVLQSQMQEVSRELTDMRVETRGWEAKHELTHERERSERIVTRRWAVGSIIAGLTGMAGVVAMFLELLARVH